MTDLGNILENESLGAREILLKVIVWLRTHQDYLNEGEREATLDQLRHGRNSMAGLRVLARRLEEGLRENKEASPLLDDFEKEIINSSLRIASNIYPLLQSIAPVSILTLSHSSTLIEVMWNVSDLIGEIHVLESHPGGEGVRMVKELSRDISDVACHSDREIKDLSDRCDLGIIGADTVYPDGSVLNKVLSRKLAEEMRKSEKPLYVVADRWKQTTVPYSVDLLSESDRKIFEQVPSDWVTDIITD